MPPAKQYFIGFGIENIADEASVKVSPEILQRFGTESIHDLPPGLVPIRVRGLHVAGQTQQV